MFLSFPSHSSSFYFGDKKNLSIITPILELGFLAIVQLLLD